MIDTSTVPVVRVLFDGLPGPGVAEALISPIRGVWISGWTLTPCADGGSSVDAIDEELEIPDPSQRLEFETWLREQHARWLDGRAPVALEADEVPHVIGTRFVPTSSTEYVVETDLSNGMTLRLFYFTDPESLDEFALESPARVSFEDWQTRAKLEGEVYRAYAATREDGEDSSEVATGENEPADSDQPDSGADWRRRVADAIESIDGLSAGRSCHNELADARQAVDDGQASSVAE